jgi:hypothetical protein
VISYALKSVCYYLNQISPPAGETVDGERLPTSTTSSFLTPHQVPRQTGRGRHDHPRPPPLLPRCSRDPATVDRSLLVDIQRPTPRRVGHEHPTHHPAATPVTRRRRSSLRRFFMGTAKGNGNGNSTTLRHCWGAVRQRPAANVPIFSPPL